jgi:hypothetical protein
VHYEFYKWHDSQKKARDEIRKNEHFTERNAEVYHVSSYKLQRMITNSLTEAAYDGSAVGPHGRHDPWLEASQSVGGREEEKHFSLSLPRTPSQVTKVSFLMIHTTQA